MPIKVSMNEALKRRCLKGKDLARLVGISETQLSMFRADKVKGVRFSTLSRICAVLECPLSDVVTYEFSPHDLEIPMLADEDD
jgi:putative transcriptional regulator